MFFEKEIFSFRILDILKLQQGNVTLYNQERNFNALSFRLRSDTYLKTNSYSCHLKDNSIAYVPARLNYHRESKTDELIVVHFDSQDYHTEQIEFFHSKKPEKFIELFQRILRIWEEKAIGYQYECSAVFYQILAECYAQNFQTANQESKIQNSVNYLLKNFKDPHLSIAEIARKSYISEVYFRKLFKQEYGFSPQKYIVKLRIQNAVGLIASKYYSLKEVAYLSGYTDYKYFSVEFKKHIGVSPSQYLYNYQK